jgi:glycosyltransferase involved in cell wall biosynthesis
MRLSIVMPSHNRLHLLKDAIETVRRQSVDDWRLAVFDNASTDPIREHIRSLEDPRIRYDRSDKFLPVTDSWNRAMSLADGDYVVLLGDDDGLLPNAIRKLAEIVHRYENPDVVYGDIYQFWHPGVAPWRRAAHVVDVHHGFFLIGKTAPFVLSRDEMRHAVTGSLDLRINFSFNSQAFFYSRDFLFRLANRGPIYRSPFPDYYIANVAFAHSRTTVVTPAPLAFAGVSKASYGYTMYNNQQEKGDRLLNIEHSSDPVYRDIEKYLLPGPTYNTNFVLAMEHVAREIHEVVVHPVAMARYRKLQIFAALRNRLSGKSGGAWSDIKARMTVAEQYWAWKVMATLTAAKVFPSAKMLAHQYQDEFTSVTGFPPKPEISPDLDCLNAVDVYNAFAAGYLP